MEVFRSHFSGRYEVSTTSLIKRDFIVKKTDWPGVGVRLQQDSNTTSFVFTAMSPGTLARVLPVLFLGIGALIILLVLRSSWKEMEEEITAFIENSADFKPVT
jgi:hypothetical protein